MNRFFRTVVGWARRAAAWTLSGLTAEQARQLFGVSRATLSGVSVTEQTALESAEYFASVRNPSEDLATLPLITYRRISDTKRERDPDFHLYPVLHDEPNEEMDSVQFVEMLQAWAMIRRNAYAEIQRTNGGKVVGLWPIPPNRVRPERIRGELFYRIALTEPDPETGLYHTYLDRARIFHVKAFTLDGVLGESTINLHQEAIGLALALDRYGAAFFGNDATPGGVYEVPGVLTDDAFARMKKELEDPGRGLDNAHRIKLLEQGMKYHETSVPNDKAQFIDSKRYSAEQMARINRVPPHKIGDLSRCMPAETLVYSEHGPKRIVDVRIGDRVWSWTGTEWARASVTNTWNNGVAGLLEIRTTNRTVRCTPQHRLLVRRRQERPLAPGEIGGKNVAGGKVRVEWRDEYVSAGELQVGDSLVTMERLPLSRQGMAPNGRALTPGFMEFCGLLLGDGNVLKQEGRPSHVAIARAGTASYMPHYREVMRQEFQRYVGVGSRSNLATAERAPVTLIEEGRCTKFASVLAAAELTMLGFAGAAFTKRVPGWVHTIADDLRLAFLRGFLDADGTVDKKGRVTFYSANHGLLDGLRHLCIGLGIPVTNTRHDDQESGPPFMVRTVKTRMFRFTCSDPGANRRIGSHDRRYIERLCRARPFGRKDRKYPRHGGRASVPGIGIARITSIRERSAEPVFDIEVEGAHCFSADGVVSHNSTNNNIEHQGIDYVVSSIRPWAVRWEKAITKQLLTPSERRTHYAEFLLDALLRGDAKSRADALAIKRQNGIINADEWRALDNMNEIEDGSGKVYLVNGNMIPVDQAGNPRNVKIDSEGRVTEIRMQPRREAFDHARVFAPLFRAAAERCLGKESAALGKALARELPAGGLKGLEAWMRTFYRDHETTVCRTFVPLAVSVGEALRGQAGPDLGEWAESYALTVAAARRRAAADVVLEAARSGAADLSGALRPIVEAWSKPEAAERMANAEASEVAESLRRYLSRESGRAA